MTELKFKVGDRVQINPEHANRYKSPWGRRVERGLFGVVDRINNDKYWHYAVRLDMPKAAKYADDWYWGRVRESDIVLAENEVKA